MKHQIPSNYREAVDYIEELPKFTEKHPLKHTKKYLEKLQNPGRELQSHPCGRYEWKRFRMCLSAGCFTGRREKNRVFHIATSDQDQ